MPVDHIRYDILVQQALRGMVRDVLTEIGQDQGPAGRPSLLHHLRHHRRGRAAVGPAARAISRRDDHRAAASVLGPQGHRRRVRGRPVVRRRARAAGGAVRGHQGVRRSVGAVHAAVRDCCRRRRTRTTRAERRTGEAAEGQDAARRRERGKTSVPASAAAAPRPPRSRQPPHPATRAAPRSCASTASARSDGSREGQRASFRRAPGPSAFCDPHRDRHLRPDRGPGRPLLGRADPALARELPDRHRAHAAAADPRARHRQARRGRGEPVAEADRRAPRQRHRQGGAGGDRRQARRSFPAGGLADRLRHPDQHERQRGDRQPRQRDARRQARREVAGASERPRQHEPVVERLRSRPRCTSPRPRRSRELLRSGARRICTRRCRPRPRHSPASSRSAAPTPRMRRR